jgi:OOP family OmpA-OmpF porin
MRKLYFAAAMALAVSAPASAGFFDFTLAPYLGFGAGQSNADLACPAGASCDDTGTIGKFYAGLEVNEYISMQLGYVDMGKFEYSGAQVGSREIKGMTAELVGTYSINPSFKLLATGGFGILDTKVHLTTPNSDVGDNDLEWKFGVGAQYNITQAAGLRVEWERYHKVGSPYQTTGSGVVIGTGENDVDLVTAGLVYKF